jgi:ABC-type polysaccharide/polyol phosphate export permease
MLSLFNNFKNNFYYYIWTAYLEIKLKYRRSIIGPWWITISSIIVILALSVTFSALFNVSSKEIILWITISLIMWNYIQMLINDSTSLFENSPLGSVKIEPLDLVLINVIKNIILLLQNSILFLVVAIFFNLEVSLISLFSLIGLIMVTISSVGLQIIISIGCLRYRDISHIIQNLLFLVFIVTPIFWRPEFLEGRKLFIIDYNIVYHYMETVRSPILENKINYNSTIISFLCTFVFIFIGYIIYNKTKNKIVYWK